jgi:BirA family transcriptional regulator, biotin operon repressor / biotin---[acetyl-CoA-carboxylase] ligase
MQFSMHHFDEIDSTMNVVRDYIKNNPLKSHGYLVQADLQTGGRGRYGRQWISPIGNLYFSLCLTPEVNLTKASELSFVICLAIGEALQEILPKKTKMLYKWPNDILIDDLKICGILLEASTNLKNELQGIIIGIGLNCLYFPENGTLVPATSLIDRGVSAADADAQKMLDRILQKISFFYEYWLKNGFQHIRELWLERAKGLNEPIKIRLEQKELTGIFRDLDAQGALIVETENETIKVTAGDVYFKST